MYAVVQVGGRQYKVSPGDTIEADFFDVPVGTQVSFDRVLLTSGDDGTKVGAPFVAGTQVAAEVIEQGRGPKLLIFKRRRRHNSKSLRGFRSKLTSFRIHAING